MSLQPLAEIRKGLFAVELSEKLGELVKTCRKTGVKGKITITLVVRPATDESVHISDDIAVSMPKTAKPVTVFFDKEDGTITRDRQEQSELFQPVASLPKAVNQE